MTSVRSLVPAFVALAVVLLGLPTAPPAGAATTLEPVLVIDGRGNGHGVGMSQDGALAMGEAGAGADEILAEFYPGTGLGTAGGVFGVRVLESAATRVDVGFPGGGEVRVFPVGPQPDGFPLTIPPGGSATLSLEGGSFHARSDDESPGGEDPEVAMPAIRLIVVDDPIPPATAVQDGTTSPTTVGQDGTTSPTTVVQATTTTIDGRGTTTTITDSSTTTTVVEDPPATTPPAVPTTDAPVPSERSDPDTSSADGLWLVPAGGSTTALPARSREYRGVVEVGGSSLGGLSLVNHLDVEEYLRGMGEVLDPSWPPAALQAQAVVARTYALRATRGGGTLCDDDRCQVYLGAGVEYPAMDEAVDATAGQVLTFEGSLASTVYSASGGGVTATPREGFGTDGSDYPYLRSAPYAVDDPPVWSASVALSALGPRLDYPGRVRDAIVSAAGPSGRVLEVVLDGDAGRQKVDGLRFASRLNLDSTLFSLRSTIGTPVDPPSPGRGSIQAPPDLAASLPPLIESASIADPEAGSGDAAHVARSVLTLIAAALLGIAGRRRRAALLAHSLR